MNSKHNRSLLLQSSGANRTEKMDVVFLSPCQTYKRGIVTPTAKIGRTGPNPLKAHTIVGVSHFIFGKNYSRLCSQTSTQIRRCLAGSRGRFFSSTFVWKNLSQFAMVFFEHIRRFLPLLTTARRCL